MLRIDQARNVECKRYETAENIDHLNKKKFKNHSFCVTLT